MTYLIYLLEASLILAGFYFFYRWLIRPLTFYGHKRVLLLFIPLLALTLPLLQIDLGWQAPIQPISWMPVQSPSVEIPVSTEEIQTNENIQTNKTKANTVISTPQASLWHWSQWPLLCYGIGVLVATILFLYKLLRVFLMHRKASPWQQNIYLSTLAKPAYSFASRIYLHPELTGESELQPILQHEQVHVKQWHTMDLILFELLAIVFWFNPVSWLLARESRLNNEMLADQVSSYGSKTDYAKLLLKYATANSSRHLSYSFARLQVRSRIEGVLGDESKSSSKVRFAMMVPIILLGIIIFSCSQELIYPEKLSYFEGKKIKLIEAIYIDEYGDQHQRDGKTLKFVNFQRNGKVENFGSTESTHNIPELNDLTIAIGFIENSPFDPKLTQGFLLEGYDYVKTYAYLFENNKPLFKPRSGQPWGYYDDRVNSTNTVEYEHNLPVKLTDTYYLKVLKNFKIDKQRNKYQTITTEKLVKRKVLEEFEYNFEEHSIKHYQAHFKDENPYFYTEREEGDKWPTEVTYKGPGEPEFDYFETHTYQFDEQDRLIAIYRNDGSLLKEIEYLNDKLINLYRVYNLKEELEYTMKVNYEFY